MLPPLSDNVITVGIFRSGERHNIIPESAQLGGTIRTFEDETLATIETRMREIFDGLYEGGARDLRALPSIRDIR